MLIVRAGDIAVLFGATILLTLVAVYWRAAHWWGSEWGWRMMLGQLGLTLMFLLGSVAVFTRDAPPTNEIARLVAAVIIDAGQVWSLTMVVRAQSAQHRRRKAAGE
jgi:hypothetical protein